MLLRFLKYFKWLPLFYSIFHISNCLNIFHDNHDLIVLKMFLKIANYSADPSGSSFSYQEVVDIEAKFKDETCLKDSLTVRNFYLFTRDYRNGTKYELLDPRNVSSIKYCHFGSRPTYLIIHGFIGYGLEEWILSLKDKLLRKLDCNVVSVDWPAGESWFLPTYMTAAGRVPDVGNDTAYLLHSLIDFKGLLLAQVHCIGHSLGGHVCGFAGKLFQGRIGRISGLDPAGPYFHHTNASKRLDKKDAIYVDVIHTNACDKWPYWTDCFGLNENVGHSNFFPNGGEHQPGCWLQDIDTAGEIGCDHERAYMYYTSSLDFPSSQTFFLARPCDSWVWYEIGNCSCGKTPQFMGINVNTELEGKFFLETTSEAPFAMQDPGCPSGVHLNTLVVIGFVSLLILCLCCVSAAILVVGNIRRCNNVNDDNEEPLFNDEDNDANQLPEKEVNDGTKETKEEALLGRDLETSHLKDRTFS